VLAVLDSERFVDQLPREVYATLRERGEHHCSVRTMYRLLRQRGPVRERRDHLNCGDALLRRPAGVGSAADACAP
jgi:hypothetical protein